MPRQTLRFREMHAKKLVHNPISVQNKHIEFFIVLDDNLQTFRSSSEWFFFRINYLRGIKVIFATYCFCLKESKTSFWEINFIKRVFWVPSAGNWIELISIFFFLLRSFIRGVRCDELLNRKSKERKWIQINSVLILPLLEIIFSLYIKT